MTALIVGTLLALGALAYVLYPLLMVQDSTVASPGDQPLGASAESREQAIDALREIEFDRETGKLSDSDYASLKTSYTQRAIEAMRSSDGPKCAACDATLEHAAKFCSNCGREL